MFCNCDNTCTASLVLYIAGVVFDMADAADVAKSVPVEVEVLLSAAEPRALDCGGTGKLPVAVVDLAERERPSAMLHSKTGSSSSAAAWWINRKARASSSVSMRTMGAEESMRIFNLCFASMRQCAECETPAYQGCGRIFPMLLGNLL